MMYVWILFIWFVCGYLFGRWSNKDKATSRDMILWQQGYNCGWNDHKRISETTTKAKE